MKKLIPFIILTFSLFLLNSCFKANDNVGHDGRCTGSAYCSACSNCSRCGHCSGGGTCGVCGGGSSGRTYTSSSSSYSRKSKSRKTSSSSSDNFKPNNSRRSRISENPKAFVDNVNVDTNSNNMVVAIRTTNVFEKPSFQSKVIENVLKNTKLITLSKNKSWYKVKVKKSGKVGYVFEKDIKN